MGYREFQRRHPEFPRLMSELEGKLVKLKRPIETRGGVKFDAGETLQVSHVSAGSLHLKRLPPKSGFIRGVHPSNVEYEKETV